MTPEHDDPLADLRARIIQTREAAERLASEASSAWEPGDAGDGPAWFTDSEGHARRTIEVQALVALLESLRELIPDELREQFRELVRQVLLLARALIDWWVERIGATASSSAGDDPFIQDIPIA